MTDLVTRAKGYARKVEAGAQRLASVAGLAQSEEKIARQSRAYWRNADSRSLDANSHAYGKDGIDMRTWAAIGIDAWDRFRAAHLALMHDRVPLDGTVLDYGCGHGAQAAEFARHGFDVIGVDIQQSALDACAYEVGETFLPVLIDNPENVCDLVPPDSVDAFVSFYTFELIPGQKYGERVLEMAFEVLRPGGMGFVQFKYPVSWWDESRRFGYNHRNVSGTTKYRVDEFWSMLKRVGFIPGYVTVSEKDALDSHYAYVSFVKPVAS